MTIEQVLTLAKKHANKDKYGNAHFCICDCIECIKKNNTESAYFWALRSLEYSIGVFHADYKKTLAFLRVVFPDNLKIKGIK